MFVIQWREKIRRIRVTLYMKEYKLKMTLLHCVSGIRLFCQPLEFFILKKDPLKFYFRKAGKGKL